MSESLTQIPRDKETSFVHESALVMTMDVYSYGREFFLHWAGEQSKVRIGRYTSIAQNVSFMNGQEHNINWGTTYPFQIYPHDWTELRELTGHPATRGDIHIGSDVWLGFGALIRSGVSIGDGAVVGMGSVVTRDVPPYAIVAGNPARVIRYRFAPELITEMLDLAWWNCSPEIVRRIAPMLSKPLDHDGVQEIKKVIHESQGA